MMAVLRCIGIFVLCMTVVNCRIGESFKKEMMNALKDVLYDQIENSLQKTNEEDEPENDEEELNESLKDKSGDNKCDFRCGSGPWRLAGQCNKETGKCRCIEGWTGPNSEYISKDENTIEATYCVDKCKYSEDSRNPSCVYEGHKKIQNHFHEKCHSKCGLWGTGKCLTNGRCLCHWGFTGPSALFVNHGNYDGRIAADYCTYPCHYTPGRKNLLCGGDHHKYQLVHMNRHGDALSAFLKELREEDQQD